MLWGVSSVALYVPWAGGAGPWISVSLWLWLGVLDASQGVGLGMILLQTLSRLHVCTTLAFSQMLGSVVVIVARPTVPRQQVFPDLALWNVGDGFKYSPFASVPFWIALVCQIVVVVGYFWYYRKEQLGT
jgi:alpha-1,3-glucan synthase